MTETYILLSRICVVTTYDDPWCLGSETIAFERSEYRYKKACEILGLRRRLHHKARDKRLGGSAKRAMGIPAQSLADQIAPGLILCVQVHF